MNIIGSLIIFYIIFGTEQQRDAVFNGLIGITLLIFAMFFFELVGLAIPHLFGTIADIFK